jgi:hypothetical protein
MSPVLGQIYAPFYYPELTTPRFENEILKANEPAPYGRFRMTPKNIPQNLVRLSL